MTKPMIAGNWKMHGLLADAVRVKQLGDKVSGMDCDVLICPPFTLLDRFVAEAAGTSVKIGAQDCHPAELGAHTGDISAVQLADLGVSHVILGHSERRTDHKEANSLVKAKTKSALDHNLSVIICIGETLAQRQAGQTLEVITRQLEESLPEQCPSAKLLVAYEPVWAIGTGLTAENEQIVEAHGTIRDSLSKTFEAHAEDINILYGGSVKPGNAREILALENVNGALVGGASLKVEDFSAIIQSCS